VYFLLPFRNQKEINKKEKQNRQRKNFPKGQLSVKTVYAFTFRNINQHNEFLYNRSILNYIRSSFTELLESFLFISNIYLCFLFFLQVCEVPSILASSSASNYFDLDNLFLILLIFLLLSFAEY